MKWVFGGKMFHRRAICIALILVIVLTTLSTLTFFPRNGPPETTSTATDTPIKTNNLITDCISKRVIGQMPMGLEAQSFSDFVTGPTETGDQRLASFQRIFNTHEWGSIASGPGSTLQSAQEVIAALHTVISDIKLELGKSRVSLLDIPCGDMTWMSRFLKTRDDIDYTGIDIVPELISKNQDTFKNHPWKFRQHDIVEKPINESFDLILSRMMLQHLMSQDVITVLERISDSGSKYLLTTTFPRMAENIDLSTQTVYRFRHLNLEIPPFSLIPPRCLSKDGEEDPVGGTTHFLGLWEMPLQTLRQCTRAIEMNIIDSNVKTYACANWTRSS